jgi:hypothetical protein
MQYTQIKIKTWPQTKNRKVVLLTHSNIFNTMYPRKTNQWLSEKPCVLALSFNDHFILMLASELALLNFQSNMCASLEKYFRLMIPKKNQKKT